MSYPAHPTAKQPDPIPERKASPEMRRDFIPLFPDELILEVFSWLRIEELSQAALVAREWRRLAGDPILWKRFLVSLHLKTQGRKEKINMLERFISEGEENPPKKTHPRDTIRRFFYEEASFLNVALSQLPLFWEKLPESTPILIHRMNIRELKEANKIRRLYDQILSLPLDQYSLRQLRERQLLVLFIASYPGKVPKITRNQKHKISFDAFCQNVYKSQSQKNRPRIQEQQEIRLEEIFQNMTLTISWWGPSDKKPECIQAEIWKKNPPDGETLFSSFCYYRTTLGIIDEIPPRKTESIVHEKSPEFLALLDEFRARTQKTLHALT